MNGASKTQKLLTKQYRADKVKRHPTANRAESNPLKSLGVKTERSTEFISAACMRLAGFIYPSYKKLGLTEREMWERLNQKQRTLIHSFILDYEKIR